MLQLIKRCPEFVAGYREYCRELYENDVVYFRPTKPDSIDDDWFCRTKPLYDRKERESTNGRSPSFHYWAVDADEFIGEFQLRTQFTENVMTEIGSVGYAVRVSKWGNGYGAEILRQGLNLARSHGMERVLLTINEENIASIRLCERFGGKLADTIEAYNEAEGHHRLRRYWIELEGKNN